MKLPFFIKFILVAFIIIGLYVKIFEVAWNGVIPQMFYLKKISFVESISLLFVLYAIGMLLRSNLDVSLSARK